MNRELNLIEDVLETTRERTDHTRDQEIKQILEALLFSSSRPISVEKLKEIVQQTYPIGIREIRRHLEEMGKGYRVRHAAFQIDELAGGYILRTVPAVKESIEQLHRDRRVEKLSRAATEVLAIIAYKQPITRREIEGIRGVDSSGTVSALQERGLIEVVGRKEVVGRPIQYGVTKRFLQHFGLKDRADLTDVSA